MFRRSIVFASAVLLLSADPASAQSREEIALDGLAFREIGPAIMGGRVADIEGLESNSAVFYVGLATGGVWRTENQGSSWTPLFDDQPCSSIGDVTVDQSNPNVIWVGTGEPQNRQSSPYGCGVFKSTDGGRSWMNLGLTETRHVSRIRLHPRNPDVAYVAAVGHLFGPNDERGVYRTQDGGESWERVLYINENTGAIDLAMDPNDPNTLFAAMYQRQRTAFGFSASGGGGGLYRSTDGGDTWSELTEGLPTGEKGRIGIDVYRGDGNLVYATVESTGGDTGLYRSLNRGESWEKVGDRNPRPMYFSQVRVDPNNPERIYLGGVQFSASDDGGRTWWQGDAAEGVHVDHHAIWIDPNNSLRVLLGSDGGVSSSVDGARTWRMHNNFAIGQFYEIGVDNSEPYRVCGGLQDNSGWCAPNQTNTAYGLMNRDWIDVWGGDGFYNKFDPSNPDIVYSESQGGNSGRVNLATGEVLSMRPAERPTAGNPDPDYRFNWNAPIEVSRHTPNTVYVGSNHLMRSRNQGATWEEVSPDLTRQIDRDTLPIMGARVERTTLSGNDGISAYGTISIIEVSPLSGDLVWVGTDDGNVQVTRDGGATWTNVVDRIRDLPARSYVSRIDASYHEEGRVYVSFDRHLDDDYGAYVFVSEDYGRSWKKITNGLPTWSVNVVREHPRTENLLFLGNEIGVFASFDRGASWHRMKGIPTVPVDDIVIHERDNDLVLGTHGRSIWILDDLGALEDIARQALAEPAHLFPVAPATVVFRLGGWPFWGDAYVAERPPEGAVVRYWLAEKADGATLTVATPMGETIRTLEPSGDAGLGEVVWDLREDAPVSVPPAPGGGGGGRGGGGFGGASPRGPLVLPGTYLVRLEVGDLVSEQEVEVRLDPRVETNAVALRARYDASKSAATISGTIALAGRAAQRLSQQLADASHLLDESDAAQELKDAAAGLVSALDSIRSELGEANPGRAASGIERNAGPPSTDELWAIGRAWDLAPPLVARLNALITERVPELYRRLDQAGVRPPTGEAVPMPRRPGG